MTRLAPPRPIQKHTLDEAGNWVMKPFIVWRDEAGVHDRPAIAAVKSTDTGPKK